MSTPTDQPDPAEDTWWRCFKTCCRSTPWYKEQARCWKGWLPSWQTEGVNERPQRREEWLLQCIWPFPTILRRMLPASRSLWKHRAEWLDRLITRVTLHPCPAWLLPISQPMQVSSVLHFWRRWYVTYPTTRPGVKSVLSLFSSDYLVHDTGTVSTGILGGVGSSGIFCEHILAAWRVLRRLVEWHWDERLIEAIRGHDHRAPLGQPHSDDFNMMRFCQGLTRTPPSMLCFDCNDTSSTFEPHP